MLSLRPPHGHLLRYTPWAGIFFSLEAVPPPERPHPGGGIVSIIPDQNNAPTDVSSFPSGSLNDTSRSTP